MKETILSELKSGVTPQKISQSLSVGILIGGFPLLGFTTGLGLLLGFIFRLNHVVVQATNYLMYPVQILLIPIYIKIVGHFMDVGNVPIRPDIIYKMFSNDWRHFLKTFGLVGLYAVIFWAVLSPILYFVFYRIFLGIITKVKG